MYMRELNVWDFTVYSWGDKDFSVRICTFLEAVWSYICVPLIGPKISQSDIRGAQDVSLYIVLLQWHQYLVTVLCMSGFKYDDLCKCLGGRPQIHKLAEVSTYCVARWSPIWNSCTWIFSRFAPHTFVKLYKLWPVCLKFERMSRRLDKCALQRLPKAILMDRCDMSNVLRVQMTPVNHSENDSWKQG